MTLKGSFGGQIFGFQGSKLHQKLLERKGKCELAEKL